MTKTNLQKQATILINQLSTEKLKEAVDYLADLRCKEAQDTSTTLSDGGIPQKGLGTIIHELFKSIGGVELEIPPREPMREPPRFD